MSRTCVASLDLTDPAAFVEDGPYRYFAEVRARCPVYWQEGRGDRPGFWVVADHRNVVSCYSDPAAFASGRGTVLDVLLRGDDAAGGRMLAVTDRPRHRELRALLWRAISPKVLARVEERVQRSMAGLVERAVQLGSFDFAAEVADHLPITTICDLLEIPPADRPDLLAWSKGALTGAEELDALESRNEMVFYFMDLVERRRRNPGEDVVSQVATGRIQGELLSLEEAALNCYSLVIGGDESSRVSAVSTVKALADNPRQWRALLAGEVDLDLAVEEAVRWATAPLHFARTATGDQVVGGRQVRAGDIVSLWNISANNDEAVFQDPRTFDLSRTPNRHVAFGHGPHYCLGAHLGRVELRALLTTLAHAVSGIEVLAAPTPIASTFLNGYHDLPVRFLPR